MASSPSSRFKGGAENINRDGRPKGAANKIKRLSNDERIALVKNNDLMPLIFLQSVVMDEGEITVNRIKAASEVAPYLHRKKPVAIEGGDRPLTILSADQLANMGDEQLSVLSTALMNLGVGLEKHEPNNES